MKVTLPETLSAGVVAGLLTVLLYSPATRLQADTTVTGAVTCQQQVSTKILGGVETLALPAAGLTMDARIDTGADLSSLDARNIQEFTRDKTQWVSFQVVDRTSGKSRCITTPLDRHIHIKRHGLSSQCRPVVCLAITMGGQQLDHCLYSGRPKPLPAPCADWQELPAGTGSCGCQQGSSCRPAGVVTSQCCNESVL